MSMQYIEGGGGAREWTEMNSRNMKKFSRWHKKPFVQHNQGRQIGLPMIQVEY